VITEVELDLQAARSRLMDLGFWVDSPFPYRAGDSRLFVAMRDLPTLRHFDPELVSYWRTNDGRGRPSALSRETPMPFSGEFSWGKITLIDRLGVRNGFVALGGTLNAAETAMDTTTAVFRTPGPILRVGGHSQNADVMASDLGAFFGRIMVPIDFRPGIEQAISAASPMERYAAFVACERSRFSGHLQLRETYPHHALILAHEAHRLEHEQPAAWAAGCRLVQDLRLLEGSATA
jgi:hypothetical protein